MTDDPIGGLIRSLPRSEPSPGFTRRVMEKIGESGERRAAARFRPAFAAAIVAIVIASLGGGMAWQRQQQETRRVEAMRAETERIRAELEAMRAQARKSNEIYLGESGDREYVLDLRQFMAPDAGVRQVSQTY
jgi:hypothetical protein